MPGPTVGDIRKAIEGLPDDAPAFPSWKFGPPGDSDPAVVLHGFQMEKHTREETPGLAVLVDIKYLDELDSDTDDDEDEETCPECDSDFYGHGQYTTRGGRTLCFACGRAADGLTPIPIDIDRDFIRDYVREEGAEARAAYERDLNDAGVEYEDNNSSSGMELAYEMSLRQAFWLSLNRGWFPREGFYEGPAENRLVELLVIDDVDDIEYDWRDLNRAQKENAADQIRRAWLAYDADPNNKAKTFAETQRSN